MQNRLAIALIAGGKDALYVPHRWLAGAKQFEQSVLYAAAIARGERGGLAETGEPGATARGGHRPSKQATVQGDDHEHTY